MTPQAAIAMLDGELAALGEDVELQRLTGTQVIPFKATVRGFVRGYSPDELVGNIIQGDSRVILSPTHIEAKGWPGPNSSATPTTADRRVPRKDDKIMIAGKLRNVEAGVPFYLNDTLVRIELQVRG